jgi:hypothetical protein
MCWTPQCANKHRHESSFKQLRLYKLNWNISLIEYYKYVPDIIDLIQITFHIFLYFENFVIFHKHFNMVHILCNQHQGRHIHSLSDFLRLHFQMNFDQNKLNLHIYLTMGYITYFTKEPGIYIFNNSSTVLKFSIYIKIKIDKIMFLKY